MSGAQRPAPEAGAISTQCLFSARREPRHGGAKVCFGSVPEGFDEGVLLECCLHETALDAAPAAVHEAHLAQSGGMRSRDVLFDDRPHVARVERVQVERGLDRDLVRLVHGLPRPRLPPVAQALAAERS
jgi:hypothetical protein